MTPAFQTSRQAAGFLALIAAILMLPLIAGPSLLPARSEIYTSIAWRFGGHPVFQNTIFREKGDIDIAFIGSSRIWNDINPVHVRQKLSESLGREAKVNTLGWNTAGFDALYFIAKDLLENRRVKMLVVNDEYNPEIGGSRPQRLASRWFRFSENAKDLGGLSLTGKSGYYASAVLGMPRNLLGLVRNNLPARSAPAEEFSPEKLYKARDSDLTLGALAAEKNFFDPTGAFVPYVPQTDCGPGDVAVWSETTRDVFATSGSVMTDLQTQFAKKLAALARHHHATLVFLYLPNIKDAFNEKIHSAAIWPELLGSDVKFVGLPPARLFKDMSPAEIQKLYSDPTHLNKNGQEYFTPIVTPAIIDLYRANETH